MTKTVLAILVQQRDRAVPVDEVQAVLYGAEPPRHASGAIKNMVHRLRKQLPDDQAIIAQRRTLQLVTVTVKPALEQPTRTPLPKRHYGNLQPRAGR